MEERRLLAGIQVFVFDDADSSQSFVEGVDRPYANRPVYLDLNRDSQYQSNEPWVSSDDDGLAEFVGLVPGNYEVRLLGSNRRLTQTFPSVPETVGATHAFSGTIAGVEQDGTLWSFEGNTLNRSARGSERVLAFSSFGQETIEQVLVNHDLEKSDVVVYVLTNDEFGSKSIWQIAQSSSTASSTPTPIRLLSGLPESSRVTSVENGLIISGDSGIQLLRFSEVENEFVLTTIGDILDHSSSLRSPEVQSWGSDGFVVLDTFGGNSRISAYRFGSDAGGTDAVLVGTRTFSAEVHAWQVLSGESGIALDSNDGFAILRIDSQLTTKAILQDAVGPIAVDPIRGFLFTGSRSSPGSLTGWTLQGLKKTVSLQLPLESGNLTAASSLWLDPTSRYLVGTGETESFTFDLNVAVAATATVLSSGMTQVQIGLRKVGENRAPSLTSIKVAGSEDTSLILSSNFFGEATRDVEDDSIVYVLRSAPSRGAVNLSSNGSMNYQPFADWHGEETVLIQAFDGIDWSQPAPVVIDIESVDDLPRGIHLPANLIVPESNQGSVLGEISVDDVDPEDIYQWEISDARFAVRNGAFRLRDGVSLDYEKENSIPVTIRAINVEGNVSLETSINVLVSDQDDPATGVLLEVSRDFKPNVPGSVVATLKVLDEDQGEVYDISVGDSRFEVRGNSLVLKSDQSLSQSQMETLVLDVSAQSQRTGKHLELSTEMNPIDDEDVQEEFEEEEDEDEDLTPYHNDENPFDVNGDGVLSPLDPLILINFINTTGGGPVGAEPEGEGAPGLDVDGDGQVTPLDILILINEINRRAQTGASGRPNPKGGSSGGTANGGGNRGGLSGEGEGPSASSIDSTIAGLYTSESDEIVNRRIRRVPR